MRKPADWSSAGQQREGEQREFLGNQDSSRQKLNVVPLEPPRKGLPSGTSTTGPGTYWGQEGCRESLLTRPVGFRS